MRRDVPPAELAKYRLDRAKEDLDTAIMMLQNKKFEASINRSYYAIFHAARALLALEQKDYKKHSGVISHFNREYIKPGLFDKAYGQILTRAFEIRNETDYEDFYVLPKDSVMKQANSAEKFINAIEEYIKRQ